MDVVGTLGGVHKLLTAVFGVIIGSYIAFSNNLALAGKLYKYRQTSDEIVFEELYENNPVYGVGEIELTQWGRIRVFLAKTFGCTCRDRTRK